MKRADPHDAKYSMKVVNKTMYDYILILIDVRFFLSLT